MSVASWARTFARLGLAVLGSLLGWILIAPIACLVPKRRDWIAVIGRQHGQFLDNAKYFFLQACTTASELRIAFITEHPAVLALLSPTKYEALAYPGWRGCWYLLRCGSAIVDSMDWYRHGRRFLLARARLLQLWHGVGFKRIERDRWHHETGRPGWASTSTAFKLRMTVYWITGRMVRYDAVSSTSRFYRDDVFSAAFLARHQVIAGYPRNTFGTATADNEHLVWSTVDHAAAKLGSDWKHDGTKMVIVAPTVRDSGTSPMHLDAIALHLLNRWCELHRVEFVFKFHPSETGASEVAGPHVHVCAPNSDIYPLLPFADALVTDFSSMYMDFLLLDRPTAFLIPDGDHYMRADREVQFNLADMLPGPVVGTWKELLDALESQWTHDTYATQRARLRRKAFDDLPQDQATPRLLAFMRQRGWVASRR